MLERHQVRVQGKSGAGSRTIVLGHGFGTDRSVWHELEPLLVRRGFRVVSYNLVYAGTNRDSFNINHQRLSAIFRRFQSLQASPSRKVEKRRRFSCFPASKGRVFDFQRYANLRSYAEDLLEIVDALQLKRIIFVGHSVSGMIGLLASTKKPGLFERMLLLAASPRYLDDPETGYKGGFSEDQLDETFKQMETNYGDWAKGRTSHSPLAR